MSDDPDDVEPDVKPVSEAWVKKQIGDMAPDEWYRWHLARRQARKKAS